jgi:hypothetical protein
MLSNHIIFHNLLNLLSELSTDSVTELLEPWGFDSVESLKNAIIETTGDLTRAVTKGHSEIDREIRDSAAASLRCFKHPAKYAARISLSLITKRNCWKRRIVEFARCTFPK